MRRSSRRLAGVAKSSKKRTPQRAVSTVAAKRATKKRSEIDSSSTVTVGKEHPMRKHESDLTDRGFKRVVGVDEAGRGPLAGPVVAAACHVPLKLKVREIIRNLA